MDDATFLYPAKAAAGLCARLARCGGRGFRIQACRLVLHYYYTKEFVFLVYKFIMLIIAFLKWFLI